MLTLGPATRIFLAVGATDLRKSFAGLSDLVQHQFQADPLSGHLFVFTNRHRNRIKVLYFDGTGMWVCGKQLARGNFAWPQTATAETGARQIFAEELAMLLSGMDLRQTQPRRWWRPRPNAAENAEKAK